MRNRSNTMVEDPVSEQAVGQLLTEEEEEEAEGLERRSEWIHGLLGTEDVTRVLQELDRFRSRRPLMRAQARAAADPGGELPKSGHEARSADAKLRVTRTKDPGGVRSFGRTDTYVKVAAPGPFSSAFLRFGLKEEETAHLHTGSIAVARWDETADAFSLVPQSGFNADRGYAYARISRPGIYTAIGLPRDPRLLTTLKLFAAAEPWLHDREVSDLITDRICQVILCADFMREAAKNSEWLSTLGLDRDDLVGG